VTSVAPRSSGLLRHSPPWRTGVFRRPVARKLRPRRRLEEAAATSASASRPRRAPASRSLPAPCGCIRARANLAGSSPSSASRCCIAAETENGSPPLPQSSKLLGSAVQIAASYPSDSAQAPIVATTSGWLCRAASLCLPDAGSTKPTARASDIPSLAQRSSIAASRVSSALGAEYVLQSAPKVSSIASVRRPSFETRQNSIGASGPFGANGAAILSSPGLHISEPHPRTAHFTIRLLVNDRPSVASRRVRRNLFLSVHRTPPAARPCLNPLRTTRGKPFTRRTPCPD
jgi:hypothetical protein